MKLLEDLFKGPGNVSWELARILGAWAVASYTGVFIGVFVRGAQEIDFSSLGVGYAAVMAGAGGFIWAKDTARTAAISQVSQDKTAAEAATN